MTTRNHPVWPAGILTCLVGFCLAGVWGAMAPQSGHGQGPSALVAPGDVPDLALVFTGGVVGYVEPCG